MITVNFYFRKDDPACGVVEQNLEIIRQEIPFELVRVDVDSEPALTAVFGKAVPLVKVGPYTLYGEIGVDRLRIALGAAQDRQTHLKKLGDQKYEERYQRARTFTTVDRITSWLSNHYLALFNLLLFLYVGLAFLAPVLMKAGLSLPARTLYTVYSPLCHQFAFRSWFLFGEQAYYPRELAGGEGVISYEVAILKNQNVVENSLEFINTARSFNGNDQVGYKTALCERDVAMYGGMLLFGLVFAATGRKIKQIPWYLWVVLGLIPIGVDGASQIPSLLSGMPDWLPIRESTPVWRSLTGALFGICTTWYLYPLFEETMRDTRAFLASKKEVIAQTRSS